MQGNYLSSERSAHSDLSVAASEIRNFNWTDSPLGVESRWPPNLLTALTICLGSSLPMLIAWGPQFIIFHNDAWRKVSAPNRSLIGVSARDAWLNNWDKIAKAFSDIIETGQPSQAEESILPLRHDDRYIVKASSSLVPIFGSSGQVDGIFATVTQIPGDLVDRREHLLKESEERFTNMADHTPVIVWVTNTEGYCTYVNRRWYEFTGQTQEEALGHGWMALVHSDDQKHSFEAYVAANKNREAFGLDYRIRRADGEYRWIIGVAAPRFSDDGEFLGYIGSIIDITERKQAETDRESFLSALRDLNETLESKVAERTSELLNANEKLVTEAKEREKIEEALRQAQKMETIGQLTGGIAHDFNNLLTIIMGNLETLLRRLDKENIDPPALKKLADNAFFGAQRAASLTQRLLAFSRRQPLDPQSIDLNKLMIGMEDILYRTLGEKILIQTIFSDNLWTIHADYNQLENALLNLSVNSRDAMKAGGKLTIETANIHLDESYASQYTDVIPGQYVAIAISDTGSGMPKEIIDKAFEPFFTTKDVGHGTGLGLSQVYGFVRQSGGHVEIYSEVGIGTCVKIYLPRFHTQEIKELQENNIQPIKGNSLEKILVVEDEREIQSHTITILHELEYNVISASNGQEALDLLERNQDTSLLFTDIGLPGGMTGQQLADEVRQRWPWIKILFTTGYAQNAFGNDWKSMSDMQLLTKPFTYADLSIKLRTLLDAPAIAPCILVVEDEVLVRMVTVDDLKLLGCRVEEAATAKEALNKINALGTKIDAAIIDLGLPDQKGDTLVKELRRVRDDIPIVIASGYGDALVRGQFPNDHLISFLEKPYLSNQLTEALEKIGVKFEKPQIS